MEIAAVVVIFFIIYLIIWGSVESMYVHFLMWRARRRDAKRERNQGETKRIE